MPKPSSTSLSSSFSSSESSPRQLTAMRTARKAPGQVPAEALDLTIEGSARFSAHDSTLTAWTSLRSAHAGECEIVSQTPTKPRAGIVRRVAGSVHLLVGRYRHTATRDAMMVASSPEFESRQHRVGRLARWPCWHCLPVFAVLTLWPSSAMANVGLPMLFVVWPSAWVLFAPVCVVEAMVAKRMLSLPTAQCARLALRANAWSTLAGIPLTWLALVLVEVAASFGLSIAEVDPGIGRRLLAPVFAPWLWPTDQSWHLFAAAAFLCIPFMLVSMRVERWSAEKQLPRDEAQRWAQRANLVTYVPIIAVLVGMTAISYAHTH